MDFQEIVKEVSFIKNALTNQLTFEQLVTFSNDLFAYRSNLVILEGTGLVESVNAFYCTQLINAFLAQIEIKKDKVLEKV